MSSKNFWCAQNISLGTKVALLVVLAAVGGNLIGLIEAFLGYPIWPMWAGLLCLVIGLLSLGRVWITSPYETLVKKIDRVDILDRTSLDSLSSEREDEVGQIARRVCDLVTTGLRHGQEARWLRRTLDKGVESATRKATQELRNMAMHDPLTGLGNRRFLDEHLEPLVKSASASKTELVCIAVDMDNFKTVNDEAGHGMGDELLVLLAEVIRGSIRQEDFCVRLGGDEFVILMPGCGVDRACEFGKQIRSLFCQHTRAVLPDHIRSDLSIGIALLSSSITNGRELLEAADKKLYAAKHNGKGRIIAA